MVGRHIVWALAAPLFLAMTISGPADAAIDQASAHYTAPNWSFRLCRDRIQSALKAEGLNSVEEGANTGDFRGYSEVRRDADGSLDTAVVNCWSTSGGMRITFACASQTPNNRATELCNRLIARVFGNHPSGGSGTMSGTWIYRDGGFTDAQIFSADGTARSRDHPESTATWSIANNQLVVRWINGWINSYTLPVTNGQLSGTAQGPGGERRSISLTHG